MCTLLFIIKYWHRHRHPYEERKRVYSSLYRIWIRYYVNSILLTIILHFAYWDYGITLAFHLQARLVYLVSEYDVTERTSMLLRITYIIHIT